MLRYTKRIPVFVDIVFENRNKDYGAYQLRKKYNRNVLMAMLAGILVISTAVITPYLDTRASEKNKKRVERQVVINLENLDQPQEKVEPPPPPAPPPQDVVKPYVAPVVVDSIKPKEMQQLMTADQAQVEVKNEEVTMVETIQEEVKEEEAAPTAVFVVVEEMPVFPGGEEALTKYIYANISYPDVAKENNIQGTVIMGFIVNYKGIVDRVTVLKGVDPALDNEAIRVIKSIPPWKPGKQNGKPVNVSFSWPIKFRLN